MLQNKNVLKTMRSIYKTMQKSPQITRMITLLFAEDRLLPSALAAYRENETLRSWLAMIGILPTCIHELSEEDLRQFLLPSMASDVPLDDLQKQRLHEVLAALPVFRGDLSQVSLGKMEALSLLFGKIEH